jgi:hypothetical protein
LRSASQSSSANSSGASHPIDGCPAPLPVQPKPPLGQYACPDKLRHGRGEQTPQPGRRARRLIPGLGETAPLTVRSAAKNSSSLTRRNIKAFRTKKVIGLQPVEHPARPGAVTLIAAIATGFALGTSGPLALTILSWPSTSSTARAGSNGALPSLLLACSLMRRSAAL